MHVKVHLVTSIPEQRMTLGDFPTRGAVWPFRYFSKLGGQGKQISRVMTTYLLGWSRAPDSSAAPGLGSEELWPKGKPSDNE